MVAACCFVAACGDSGPSDPTDKGEIKMAIEERLVQADLKPVDEITIEEKSADIEKTAEGCTTEEEGCQKDSDL